MSRTTAGGLAISYRLQGALERLRVPSPQPRRPAERLWQHTCCELFIRPAGLPAYYELNFSPSGEWAAYAFERYRERVLFDEAALDPQVNVRRGENRLELDALIPLERLSALHARAKLSLALSAVVEETDGKLFYWALSHPAGEPDFHHPDSFVLELDEARN